jgi:Ca2+/Na+ antiporter
MEFADHQTSLTLIAAAVVGVVFLAVLRTRGSSLYHQSAGFAWVLIVFSSTLALDGSLSWRIAAMLVPLGLVVWWKNPFGRMMAK